MKKRQDDAPPKIELRTSGEIRGTEEDGTCEAYLTKWGSVDSYRTQFEAGAFKNTFEKRGAEGTRLFWNHRELAGKILELREDDYGPYAKCKFNLDTRAGAEAYAHVRDGDVNCFSFGFNTVKSHPIKGGVRSITEVDMLECGPVVFQANDEAVITGVRSDDFNETLDQKKLKAEGWQIQCSLEWTIDDIYWGDSYDKPDEIIEKTDTAIAAFHVSYMEWLNRYYDQFESRDGVAPRECRNALMVAAGTVDLDQMVKETSLTQDDVDLLKRGKLLPAESRGKIGELSEGFQKDYKTERRKTVEGLCNELRSGGFTEGERYRFQALLDVSSAEKTKPNGDTVDFLKNLRSSLKK